MYPASDGQGLLRCGDTGFRTLLGRLRVPGLQVRGLQMHGLQVEGIRNQRKLFRHAENQRAAGPDSDADIPVAERHLPAQRPDQVEFTARTDPILDRG